jgi:CBS domain-containing protein
MNADITIRDVMSREFVGVSESDPISETVRLMLDEDADCAVVLRGSDPVGTVTDRDVLSLMLDDGRVETATVADAMGERTASVRSDQDLVVAIDRLSATAASQLVVLETGSDRPIGLLTYRDVATALAYSLESGRGVYDHDYEADDPAVGAGGFEAFEAGDGQDADRTDPIDGTDRTNRTDRTADDTLQSICESCGTLSHSLSDADGQLLCPDCRDV